ncbi:putative ribosomal protein L23 [Colletotrichum karsti]|uniref:Large ribosomal subunit protein uL23m n=1 Tax=Colletotrichum karsti TaxID=1095194 RepID=A0A9P6LR36_9PEZI|nr:putative ribosomal protein L23 [Colletotrichum karsti]KAF9881792.1 putative ribosomal protein L23 [Colletotrichum karsti]
MATSATEAVTRAVPNFRLGLKKVYLPSHTITLIRKDKLPPNWAVFQVPLTFTKFDLRDYLWNLYGVETTAVRSWVMAKKVERKSKNHGHYRPQSDKFMQVQLVKPFAFPPPPEDLEPWNKKLWKAREQLKWDHYKPLELRQQGKLSYPSRAPRSLERKALAEQAKALLGGEKEWEGPKEMDSKWDMIVEASKKMKNEGEKKAEGEAKVEGEDK